MCIIKLRHAVNYSPALRYFPTTGIVASNRNTYCKPSWLLPTQQYRNVKTALCQIAYICFACQIASSIVMTIFIFQTRIFWLKNIWFCETHQNLSEWQIKWTHRAKHQWNRRPEWNIWQSLAMSFKWIIMYLSKGMCKQQQMNHSIMCVFIVFVSVHEHSICFWCMIKSICLHN